MSVLMELAVASRCCLAATTFCSSRESEELVGVLQRAKGQHVRCIDFVEDGDFRIEVRIVGKRILFEVIDLILDGLGVVADRADGGHGGHVCAVGQFDRSVLRFHAVEFIGGHRRREPGRCIGEGERWPADSRC